MNISIAHTHIFQNLNINNAEFDQSSGNSFSGHEPKINSFIQSESASSESWSQRPFWPKADAAGMVGPISTTSYFIWLDITSD